MRNCSPRSNFGTDRQGPSDEFLVDEAKRGNELAIVELWRRYGGVVRSKVWRITGNWEDTDDVLQETYLSSYVHLHQFDGRSKFSTWLIRIAINSALMFLRKRRTRQDVMVESGDQAAGSFDFPDRREDIESFHLRAEHIEGFWRAVRKLRPSLRHIFELKYEHELSVEEVAEITGLSTPAVKARLFRARADLRNTLLRLRKSTGLLHRVVPYPINKSRRQNSSSVLQ